MTVVPDQSYRINHSASTQPKSSTDRGAVRLDRLLARLLAEIADPEAIAALPLTALAEIECQPDWSDPAVSSAARLVAICEYLQDRALASADVTGEPNSQYYLLLQIHEIASIPTTDLIALKYACMTIALLERIGWQQKYALALIAAERAIDTAARCGEFALMEQWIDLAISHVDRPSALVGICIVKLQSLLDRDLPAAAIRLGRSVLEQLGVRLPSAPTRTDVDRALQAIDRLKPPATVSTMTDPHQLAIARVAARMMVACEGIDPNLGALVVALQVNLSLRFGTHPNSAASYAAHALAVINYNGDATATERFWRLAYEIALAVEDSEQRATTLATIGLLLTHRTAHLRETIPIFQAGYQAALVTGNLTDLGHNFAGLVAAAYWSSRDLPTLKSQLLLLAAAIVAPQSAPLARPAIYDRAISYLLDLPVADIGSGCTDLDCWSDDETTIRQGGDVTLMFSFYLHRSSLGFLMGDLTAANTDSLQARSHLTAVLGSMYEVIFYVGDALIALAIEGADSARVSANRQQLADWAQIAPMNYLHQYQLVEAEMCRAAGDKAGAIEFYDLAIAGALAGEYLREAGIANELAAKFYFAWGKVKLGTEYLHAAYLAYERWGATAKLRDLTSTYPQLGAWIGAPKAIAAAIDSAESPLGISSQELQKSLVADKSQLPFDFTAYLRSIEALYSEIDLDRLLHKLMDVVVEHAGADKAALLLNRGGNLNVALEYADGDLETLDFDLHSFDRDYRLPLYLIRQVHQAQALKICYGDDCPYPTEDPYFEEHRPHSILCLPILNQSKQIGILYLENSTTTDIFTPDRVELLNIICTQAAISLENARLHQESQVYARQLERSLRDLQSSQARLHKIADNIPGAIAQVWIAPERDRELLRYISSGCDRLYELTAAQMLDGGYSLRQFEHPEDRPQIDLLVHQSRHQLAPIQLEYRIVTPSGKVKWIYIAASSLEPQPDGSFLVECTILDISERQVAQQERQQAEQQLQLTNAELLQSNRLKDQFLANMSHELRTPLNAVLGMTEGLKEGVFGAINAEQAVALSTIATSGSQLLALIDDVLELAKIEAGQLELHYTPTALVPFCESSIASIRQQAVGKQIQVSIKFQPNLPTIAIDERRIRQVLISLLDNAVKFTPAGGQIDLTVTYVLDPATNPSSSNRSVEPSARVRLTISDTGIGISPDNIKKLFQPFIQIDGAFNRQFEGTGLGLALVKRIVDLHGGTVSLSSELGLGSSFTIELPCAAVPADRMEMPAATAALMQRQQQSPSRAVSTLPQRPPLILLVEHNEANVQTMSSYLRAKGYQISIASTVREAIDLVISQPPDIILMNIQLPLVDGVATIRQIRELSDLPTIAMAALSDISECLDETVGDREIYLEAGANEYLAKPIKLKQLTSVIQQVLQVHQQSASKNQGNCDIAAPVSSRDLDRIATLAKYPDGYNS